MAPTFRPNNVDTLIVRPVHSYEGEGIYAIDNGGGVIVFYRVQHIGANRMALLSDNHHYRQHEMSIEKFNEMVLGIALYQVHRLLIDSPQHYQVVAINDGAAS